MRQKLRNLLNRYEVRYKLWRYSYKLWRSSAWNRGYYAAMKERPEHDARHEAWVNFLQRFYYEHQNCHLREKK